MKDHIAFFVSILGSDDVLVTSSDKVRYERDARYDHGCASLVLRPSSPEEISKILRYCSEHHVRVLPQGAMTGLVGASVPDNSGYQVVLTTEKLNKVIDIDPINKTAVLEAGVTLWDLNQKLASYGLFFPIDLGANPTIGGMVATNTGGSRLIKYGDVRRNVLGLEVVDGQGNLISLLKELRKDNTGVDFKQLFIGTFGVFGVVTKICVSLHALPRQTATVLVVPREASDINHILLLAEDAFGSLLSSFEGMSRNAMLCAIENVPNTPNPFLENVPEYALLIEVTSSSISSEEKELEDRLVEFVMNNLDEKRTKPIVDAITGKSQELWALRHHISEGLRHCGKVIGFDISLKRSKFWQFKKHAAELVSTQFPHVMLCDFGHYADGSDHFNLVWLESKLPYSKDAAVSIRRTLYDLLVKEYGGSYSAEHGIGPVNQEFYYLYTPSYCLEFSKQLKAMFDPFGILGNVTLGPKDLSNL